MYRIEGDGSWQNTKIWKEGKEIDYNLCTIAIEQDGCVAEVDGVVGDLDRLIIKAIYTIISDGNFTNSRVIFMDEVLRGVQSFGCRILKGDHPRIVIDAVNMPNIVEGVQ